MTANTAKMTAAEQDRRSSLMVIGLLVVMIIVGWLVRTSFQYRTAEHRAPLDPADAGGPAVTLVLPEAWAPAGEANTSGAVQYADVTATSSYKTTIGVVSRDLDPTAGLTLDGVVDREIAVHTNDTLTYPGYQLLGKVGDGTVDGQPAKVIEYAYAAKPIDVQQRDAPPVVVHAREYVVIKGTRLFLITLTADQAYYAEQADALAAIVNAIKLP
jgi:hypothetical protein